MKKFILLFVISLWFSNGYAAKSESSIDIDGLTVFKLNSVSENRLKIYGHTSGAISAGICRIIIRSSERNEAFKKFTQRFKFLHQMFNDPEEEITPIITNHAIMYKLMKVDYGFENITIETRDGKSIEENMTALVGNTPVAVLAGSCYDSGIP